MSEIYLDNSATTVIDESVQDSMIKYLVDYGNPSSLHRKGQEAKVLLEKARTRVANLLGAKSREIYFTSSGTEANNWAIRGILDKNKDKKHIITSSIEHPSILSLCEYLENEDYEVTYLTVDKNGLIDLEELEKSIKENTAIISIMYVNNEVGSMQDINKISQIAKKHNVIFHTDAVQAVGEIEINVNEIDVDLLSISGHKIHAPKGVAALYIKEGTLIESFIKGGEQEKNKRAGTENLLSIIGFGKSCENLPKERAIINKIYKNLKQELLKEMSEVKKAHLVSNPENTVDHIASFYFDDLSSSELLIMLDLKGIYASGGSACSAGSLNPSHVMKAMGYTDEEARSLIRFSFSKFNTEEEINYLVKTLKEILN